ncbi:MAG TPA: transglycosylase domain-containing protein [Kofleriaceae bacterium]|nr:transglycosylase domain-containing protein [Kofleriaceae bacterium]
MQSVWQYVRWPFAFAGLLSTIAVELLVVMVVAWPLDAAELRAGGTPLVVTDRNGVVLATVPAPGGRPDADHWVPLAEIPSVAVAALLESEDRAFWDHGGVDFRAVVRAAWLDVKAGRTQYGGSTITMQVARLTYTQGQPRGLTRKLREAVHALRIERALTKREILEQWLNRAYFGNGAWGIDAAAHTYFGKPAAALSTGEVVLLVCLPRAPTAYDPIERPGAAQARRDRVIDRMVERGLLAVDEAERAKAQPLAIRLHDAEARAPHFVRMVIESLPREVAARGGTVRTTLDARLQEVLERRAAEHVDGLAAQNVDQAGLVVLDTASGEVLAWIGAARPGAPGGAIDLVTRRRHPGSALKPFVYAAAIEAGDLPSTVAFDVRDVSPDYFVAEGGHEHGPVRYREALGSSYNFAAVHALERASVTRVMTALHTAGVATLPGTPEDYGLRLALGAAKVRLIDLAAGYGFAVRGGMVRAPVAVLSATAPEAGGGRRWRPPASAETRVFTAEASWLVMDMMADAEARRPAFGQENAFDLPWPVAAKTGTARGFADTVAVAATREVTVAAWAGTVDGSPTQGVPAMKAAAPLVRDALLAYADGRRLTLPERPADVEAIEVCEVSGGLPGPHCSVKRDWAPRGRGPTHVCAWHRAPGVVVYPDALRGWAQRVRGAE